MMKFSEITTRLHLPSSPKEIGDLNWDEVEQEFGITLPNGYKEFVSAYSTGSIGGFLLVFNPVSKNRSLNSGAIRYFLSSYAELRKDFPADYIRPTFPDLNSFLPWAVTDNGDTLVWILDGELPDNWKVGIMGVDQIEEEISELCFIEFIVQLLEKKIVSNILPKQFLEMEKNFQQLT